MKDDSSDIFRRFGKRIIIGLADTPVGAKTIFICRCDCGREDKVTRDVLMRGGGLSCQPCKRKAKKKSNP